MKKWLTVTLFSLSPMALYAASAEHGADSPLEGLLSLDMGFKVINFIALLVLLHLFVKKPLVTAFRASATATHDELSLNKKHVANKEAQLAELTAKIQGMTQELEKRKAEALANIQAEKEKMIADAHAQAERIEKAMEKRITQNLARAKNELRESLAQEAAKLAEAGLPEKVGDKEKKHLLEKYTQTLNQAG